MSQVSVRQIPLLDLKAQLGAIREEVLAEVIRVIDSQRFILGEDVRLLEEQIAAYSQARFAIGCASGSDALFLALLALGIGPGDEVLTTPYTFFATAGSIVRAGATPRFVDVEEDTFNINVQQCMDVIERHPRIRAIIPVHLFGACANMEPLLETARAKGIAIIEDAAQSIGAEYKGRRAGSIGDIACFSFFPSKNLGGFGDGGMLTTNDAALAERLAALRVHGAKRKYVHDLVGINSRLDSLQAAVLRVKLRHLDSWTNGRQQNVARYRAMFGELKVPIVLPQPAPHSTRHVYNQFVIRGRRRDELQKYLKERGVGCEVYYPLPLHLQPCFASLGYHKGDLPVSELLAGEALALPVYPELAPEDLAYVCETVQAFYSRS